MKIQHSVSSMITKNGENIDNDNTENINPLIKCMNSLTIWSEQKHNITLDYPNMTETAINKILEDKWNSLTIEEKSGFIDEAKRLEEQQLSDHTQYNCRPHLKPACAVKPTEPVTPYNLPCMQPSSDPRAFMYNPPARSLNTENLSNGVGNSIMPNGMNFQPFPLSTSNSQFNDYQQLIPMSSQAQSAGNNQHYKIVQTSQQDAFFPYVNSLNNSVHSDSSYPPIFQQSYSESKKNGRSTQIQTHQNIPIASMTTNLPLGISDKNSCKPEMSNPDMSSHSITMDLSYEDPNSSPQTSESQVQSTRSSNSLPIAQHSSSEPQQNGIYSLNRQHYTIPPISYPTGLADNFSAYNSYKPKMLNGGMYYSATPVHPYSFPFRIRNSSPETFQLPIPIQPFNAMSFTKNPSRFLYDAQSTSPFIQTLHGMTSFKTSKKPSSLIYDPYDKNSATRILREAASRHLKRDCQRSSEN